MGGMHEGMSGSRFHDEAVGVRTCGTSKYRPIEEGDQIRWNPWSREITIHDSGWALLHCSYYNKENFSIAKAGTAEDFRNVISIICVATGLYAVKGVDPVTYRFSRECPEFPDRPFTSTYEIEKEN